MNQEPELADDQMDTQEEFVTTDDAIAMSIDRLLTPNIYKELRVISRALRSTNARASLQTDDLLHGGLIRVLATSRRSFATESDFKRYAVSAIYSEYFDYRRARNALQRNGGLRPVELDEKSGASDAASQRRGLLRLEFREVLEQLDDEERVVVVARIYVYDSLADCASHLGMTEHAAGKAWGRFGRLLKKHLTYSPGRATEEPSEPSLVEPDE